MTCICICICICVNKAECQRIDAFELEKTLESPSDSTEIQPILKEINQPWIFIGRTDAEAEAPILWPPYAGTAHWKRPWCWERLRARGEGDDRGWDGWMASPTQWTWIWVDSGSWWRTGRPGKLWFKGSQSRTQLSDWTELRILKYFNLLAYNCCLPKKPGFLFVCLIFLNLRIWKQLFKSRNVFSKLLELFLE